MFEKSFYLVRTNPALTTNYKIVITNEQKIYLESYKANKILTAERFQHFEIKKDTYLFDELPKFFTGISSTVAYEVRNLNDSTIMHDDFGAQFDDIYLSGATWTQDTFYDEEFEYTAPLYVKPSAIPKGFIIFRIDDPGLDDGNSPINFRSEILNNWKIVSYFDLKESTDFGLFLKNNIEHDLFPEVPLEINFENLVFSKFNGIDFKRSGFVSKSANLENIYQKNTPIFRTEEYFTSQWKDLGIIYPNIFNIKFLFDDTPATPDTLNRWSINRYMGFYIDTIDSIMEISPYQPFKLKKVLNEDIEKLAVEEVAEIAYLLDNSFVQDVGLRKFTFDPIFGDWIDGKIYYVEWNGIFYQLNKVINDRTDIIGEYLYQINSTINIEHSVPSEITNPELQFQYKKVLINEITTLKNQIEIIDSIIFDNIVGTNIIQNTNSTFVTLKRIFEQYIVSGQLVWGFRITLEAEVDNNLFTIDNFNDADLYWIQINNKKHVIKQYSDNIPNIGGLYYIQSDEAIRINKKSEQIWINNGINTKDPLYYNETNIENIPSDSSPIAYIISRASFTDIKDFDFERTNTKYSNYEYEIENKISETLEPKLYSKDRRNLQVILENPVEINSNNFTNDIVRDYLLSEKNSYTEWLNQYEETSQIVKNGISKFFDTFELYVDFKWSNIVNEEEFSVGNTVYNGNPLLPNNVKLTLSSYQSILPLYITPTRIPILDSSGDQLFDPDTGLKLWKKNWNGDFIYVNNSIPLTETIDLNREWYREEGYILLLQDDPDKELITHDFLKNSENLNIKLKLEFDEQYPMATTMEWNPFQKSVKNPNEQLDTNYVPVSSEYITSEELWEIRNNNNISPIWSKNQFICKWGFLNSNDKFDYPYRLSFDLDVTGKYNNTSSPFSNIPYAVREFRDLDYFYRFGTSNLSEVYKNYSLHLKEEFFDIDKYISFDFNYFDWMFKSDQLTTDGLILTSKYSLFGFGDLNTTPITLFKGIKYSLFDVSDKVFNEEYLNNNIKIVEDYVRQNNPIYNDYKFSIILGRKLSTFKFNPGDNDGDYGIDIYLNDKWKHLLIHLYFEVDSPITFTLPDENEDVQLFNIETAEIDKLYAADNIATEDSDISFWEHGKIRINNDQQIGDLRIRDLKLYNFLSILNDPNYDPVNGEGRKPIQYIHIYDNGQLQIMDSITTDFVIDFKVPTEFLVKEKTFNTTFRHENALIVNNTIKNRIILDDDPTSLTGDPFFTSEGAVVNSITDINSWDGYPFGRVIEQGNQNDTRPLYDLDENKDPVVYKHSGPYTPIFLNIELFRPTGYWSLTESAEENTIPVLSALNWKFYDDFSDAQNNGPILLNFGYINEFIFSKVNLDGNILKMAQINKSDKISIYPIVDEYGYDFTQRYIFQSTWDKNFYLESRKIELPANEYPGKSGYTPFYNGLENKLIIEDDKKFNIVPLNYDYQITTPPKITIQPYIGSIFFDNSASTAPVGHDGNIYKDHNTVSEVNGKLSFTGNTNSYVQLNSNTDKIYDFRIEITVSLNTFNILINTFFCFSNMTDNRNNEILCFAGINGDVNLYIRNVAYVMWPNNTILVGIDYTFIIERINGIIKMYLNGNLSAVEIEDNNYILITSGTLAQDQDIDWGNYDSRQSLIGTIEQFQFTTATSLSNLDLMNMVADTSIIPENWTSSRVLGYDEIENSLKAPGIISDPASSDHRYEYIKVYEGQVISMSVKAKSDQVNSSLKYYCGIINYDINMNTVGTNGGRVYFVASGVYPTDSQYTLYSGLYTIPVNVEFVKPYTIFNYRNSTVVNTMWAKDFTFKITGQNKIISELQILNIDSTKDLEFELKNNLTGQVKYYTRDTIKVDSDGFIDAISKNETTIAIASSSDLTYTFKNYTDSSNLNGHQYTYRHSTIPSTPVIAEATINSDITNGDIKFEIRTNTRGNILINALIDDARAFDFSKFKAYMNSVLAPDYVVTNPNSSQTGNNIKYTIVALNSGQKYNFRVILISNAIEDKSAHIDSPQETTIVKYSEVGLLKYSGQNNDLTAFSNKAIKGITIEFWINVDGWTSNNETLMYKGSVFNSNDWSWQIRRAGNTSQLEFLTRSYVIDNNSNLDLINDDNGVYTNSLVTVLDIEDQLWHHVAFVLDPLTNQKSIYIDAVKDVLIEHKNISNIIIENISDVDSKDWPINIASNFDNGSVNFAGSIDELRIWGYARSEAEIRKNYNLRVTPTAYLDPFKPLLGYWIFDEQLGSLIFDSSVSVFESEQIKITTKTITDNGTQIITSESEEFKRNEINLHNRINISQNEQDLDWRVSGAEIKGISDERYVVELPPTTTRKKVKNIPIEVVPRSSHVIEFELPVPPVIPPLPPPTPIPPQSVVKIVEIPKDTKKIKKFVFKRPVLKKKKFFLKRIPNIKSSLDLDKIDRFSRKRKQLELRANIDDSLELDDRLRFINRDPFRILNRTTRINRNPRSEKIRIGKNRRNLINTINQFFFRPSRNIFRRRR